MPPRWKLLTLSIDTSERYDDGLQVPHPPCFFPHPFLGSPCSENTPLGYLRIAYSQSFHVEDRCCHENSNPRGRGSGFRLTAVLMTFPRRWWTRYTVSFWQGRRTCLESEGLPFVVERWCCPVFFRVSLAVHETFSCLLRILYDFRLRPP